MKICLKKDDYFIKVINNSVVYVQKLNEASEFSSMKITSFINLKNKLEQKEKANFKMCYC